MGPCQFLATPLHSQRWSTMLLPLTVAIGVSHRGTPPGALHRWQSPHVPAPRFQASADATEGLASRPGSWCPIPFPHQSALRVDAVEQRPWDVRPPGRAGLVGGEGWRISIAFVSQVMLKGLVRGLIRVSAPHRMEARVSGLSPDAV